MYNSKHITIILLLGAMLLSGCSAPLGPQDSGIAAPSLWNRLTGAAPANQKDLPLIESPEAEVDHLWWIRFGDSTLDALITEALGNNKTLQIARARVEEARAGRNQTRARLFPEINVVAGARRNNLGYTTNNKAVSIGEVDVEASWELDIFGRNRARVSEASALLQSIEASRQAVRVALLAEVARNYFDLRNYEHQLRLTRQNLETQKKTQELVKAQLQGALASDFDVQRAGAQVSATEALIPTLQTAYEATRNRLNVLLGYPPGSRDSLLKSAGKLKPLEHHILIAASARVLAARPDIRAAERRFAASISARASARAELFPNISLTALFGAQSSTPFSSAPWGIGVSLVQPILNFGRIEAQIDAADARQRQAFLGYQQTVLEALEDMENALSGYLNETKRNAFLTTEVRQNRKAADLAMQQYKNGYTGLLDVLVAVRDLLDSESSLAASDASLRNDLVNIYTAAGGGWHL
jgi:multidrug efflux system outer membrane protein